MNLLSSQNLIIPDPLKLDSYQKARQVVLDTFKDFEDLVGIYEFGRVNNPGISDLDLAFAFKGKPKDPETGRKFADRKLPAAIDKILSGSTLMVFSEEQIKDLLIWDDLKLTCLYGNEVKLNAPSDPKLRTVAQIMDWLPERLLSLKKQLASPTIPIIRFLGILHSLNYTFEKLLSEKVMRDHKQETFSKHIQNVSSMRKNFFEYKDNETELRNKLDLLCKSAFELGLEAMKATSDWMKKKEFYQVQDAENSDWGEFHLSPKSRTSGYRFTKDRHPPPLWAQPDDFYIPVPEIWAVHWKSYGEEPGVISSKVAQALTQFSRISGKIHPELNHLLKNRIRLCNSMADFLYENGFKRGLYKFGWFF